MKHEMLIMLANAVDQQGLFEVANVIDEILYKIAGDENIDYMATQNMRQISEYASKTVGMLEEAEKSGHRLDDWLEDKISKVSDDMSEIYNYIEHGDCFG